MRNLTGFSARWLCLAVLLLFHAPAAAQSTDAVPQVTRAFALENVRIVQAPGRVIEHGTVVLRNGLIEAVGPEVSIPFDAERIAGDSLVVYAGFIDGLSHTGIPEPKKEDAPERPDRPGEPTFEQAGIQPDRAAATLLDPQDSTIVALRRLGFTTAHVVPYGQMLPGIGSIILLAGTTRDALVLQRDASLFAQFEGAQGAYPATTMAVIAQLRQLYREAEQRQRQEQRYAENPSGMERPAYDAVHTAFFPVLDGTRPLFFQTNDALEIHRALALRTQLGFPLAVTGLHGAFRALETLQEADLPLFLSLDLPEVPDSAKADTTAFGGVTTAVDTTRVVTPDAPGSFFIRDLRTRSYEDTDEELENLRARQALEREQYYETAAKLHEADLRFGFSTLNVKPKDLRANLRTLIEHGLPEEAALAALTTDAAELLGLSRRLGTVEPGKIANLVVTKGPYFDEASTVRYVFVDGRKFDIDKKEPTEDEDDADDEDRR